MIYSPDTPLRAALLGDFARLMEDNMVEELKQHIVGTPLEGHNYRLAVDDHGNHGYEVGYWPDNATVSTDYVVVARCYDQQEAARLANQYNAGAQPKEPEPEAEAEAEEDEAPHKRSTRRR